MATRIGLFTALLAALLLAGANDARAAATVVIVNNNAPGVGFNDPAPRAPVGGNTGTTLGQQRLIAFQYAADKWGLTLDSPVPIVVRGQFTSLACTATSAVLGSAGASFIFANFGSVGLSPGPVGANLWHGSALADKRAGIDLNPGERDMAANFNADLNGNPACLGGRGFYLGLDSNHGNDIDLVAVLLHEFAHGLGFQQFASVTTGARIQNLDDVYNVHIFDNTQLKYWNQMTDAQRVASAINPRKVVFDGTAVNAAVPAVLVPGTPLLTLSAPAAVAGAYQVGAAAFGPALAAPGITGQIVLALDAANAAGPGTTDACSTITNPAAVAGRIALVDRGTCGFVVKVKNAQDAGAAAVLVADNVAGGPPAGLGGTDPTITIPSVRITLADGNAIKAQLAIPAAVSGTLGVNLSIRAGADAQGFALLFTPNPVQSGSTISHWDTSASPNQLMEPSINADLTQSVKPPADMTLPLLRDVGWFPDADTDGLADGLDACPMSNFSPTVVIGGEDTGVANAFFTSGCTIADLVANAAAGARNHGGFVSQVAHLTDALRAAGIITSEEKAAMQRAAARSSLP